MNTQLQAQENNQKNIVLIQPSMGISGEFSRHLPLSLLYVAAAFKELPVEVRIFDARVVSGNWRQQLLQVVDEHTILTGFTVMAGSPVEQSLEMTKLIKKHFKTKVVWGGALPTIGANSCLDEPTIDYSVSGSGMQSSQMLASLLLEQDFNNIERLKTIPGLGFRYNGETFFNEKYQGFEPVHYKDIPYHLISDYSVYGQIGTDHRIFPIYSAYGCPYACAFCVSPHLYRNFNKKWVPVDTNEIFEHILFLKNTYKAQTIYFYDDDSFVNLEHIKSLVKKIKEAHINVRLSFRGARVNEVLKMDDEFLKDLADTGTRMLHIGVESGCQRILDLFNKGITVKDIVEINRKLAKHPRLIAAYNWIVGTPTETTDEVKQTTKLLYKLIKENPGCFIFQPNVFRCIPGTDLAKVAVKQGYKTPQTLHDWIKEETEQECSAPWISKEMRELISMLQVTSYFVDDKASLLIETNSLKDRIIKFLSRMYRPLARFRFKSGCTSFLFESTAFNLAQKLLKHLR